MGRAIALIQGSKKNGNNWKKVLAQPLRLGNLPISMKATLLLIGAIAFVLVSSSYAQRPPRPGTVTPPPPPPDSQETTSPR